jgi:hypothetical protein
MTASLPATSTTMAAMMVFHFATNKLPLICMPAQQQKASRNTLLVAASHLRAAPHEQAGADPHACKAAIQQGPVRSQ